MADSQGASAPASLNFDMDAFCASASPDRVSIALRHGLTQRVGILHADRNWVRTMHDEQILGCDVPDENEVRFLTEILDDFRRFVDEIWRF